MSDIRFNQWLHNSGTGGVSQVDGGHVGIGTTNPLIPVGAGNTAILNVGVVTASTYYGSGANLTGLAGGSTGLDLDDNVKIRLGNSQDFQLYHNGNNSLIQDSGTGHVQVRSGTFTIGNLGLTKTSAIFNSGAEQELRFNNSTKFVTTNTGVSITGTAVADALNVTGTSVVATVKSTNNNYVMQMQGNNATDKVYFGTTSGNDFIIANTSSVTERLRIQSNGRVNIGVNPHVGAQSLLNLKGSGDDGNQTVLLRLGNDSSGSGTGAAIVMGAGAGASSQGATIAGFYDGTGTAFTIGTNTSFNGSTSERFRITSAGVAQFRDNQAAYTNTTHTHSGEAGFITHYTARTTYGGADLYRRMLDIASGGANPHGSSIRFLTSNNNSNPATCIERMRIMDEGGVFIGTKTHAQRYSHAEAPALLTVQNGARVSTTSSVYAAPKGGFCDHARYELEQKLISISNSNLNIVQARNGQPLTINEARSGWDRYHNLPNYLLGHAATDNINNSNFTLTLYANMTVFLLRTNGWNAVDLTGWNLIESNTSIGPAQSDTRLYVKSMAAGTYSNFDNDSAMYFFVL